MPSTTPSPNGTTFYLTTAIDYANGAPHLGHAYEKILADVIVRFQRLQGRGTHFLTGLDEHGQKVQQTAARRGLSPQQICDESAGLFRALLHDLNISVDDYIRTTEPRHKAVVARCLQQLFDAGEIYKAEYNGFYSVRQEQFVLEKDRNPDGSWPEIYGEVVTLAESNYFFRLSRHQDWLVKFITENPDWIFPTFRRNQVLEFLKEPINDLCISRPVERLAWGIPLPFDPGFVTYVWFDALVNYVSAAEASPGLWESGAHHVIGKDILVPPHSVYWPCMLRALGLALPKRLIVHGWWTLGGTKASKSTGNATETLSLAKLYGADTFRYYLIREMPVGQDSDFSREQLRIRHKTDLANDLGNLLNRLLSLAARHTASIVPKIQQPGTPPPPAREKDDGTLAALWAETAARYLDLAAGFQFHNALDALWQFIRAMNRFTEQRAPWKLGKSANPEDRALLEDTLANLAEGLRLAATALTPVMPTIAAQIQSTLGLTPADTFLNGQLAWDPSKTEGRRLAEKAILFPPVEDPATAAGTQGKP
ncbi:MAG: class I tRNA ligase family protein [Puniceicoccales bacterium]|jgi:methionyl-tRNA synthetase|nr:class I tRNA ligase family protein [Puniceicoccales bacterium]